MRKYLGHFFFGNVRCFGRGRGVLQASGVCDVTFYCSARIQHQNDYFKVACCEMHKSWDHTDELKRAICEMMRWLLGLRMERPAWIIMLPVGPKASASLLCSDGWTRSRNRGSIPRPNGFYYCTCTARLNPHTAIPPKQEPTTEVATLVTTKGVFGTARST